MNDLVDFKNNQIEALQKRVSQLETWILEITSKEAPKEYFRVVRNELLKGR